jgi:hypothetical protein
MSGTDNGGRSVWAVLRRPRGRNGGLTGVCQELLTRIPRIPEDINVKAGLRHFRILLDLRVYVDQAEAA